MKEYKYKINGKDYTVVIANVEDNIAQVEVNGTSYTVEMNKKFLHIALLALLALVLSGLSIFIKTGADATGSETIGVVSKCGFPIHFLASAPGLARAQFVALRFWLNAATWFAILTAVWLSVAFKKNSRG